MARDALPASRLHAARPRPVTCSEAALRFKEKGGRERESSGGDRKKLHGGVGSGGPRGPLCRAPEVIRRKLDAKGLKTRNV